MANKPGVRGFHLERHGRQRVETIAGGTIRITEGPTFYPNLSAQTLRKITPAEKRAQAEGLESMGVAPRGEVLRLTLWLRRVK